MWENKVPNKIKKKKNSNKFQISIWKVEKNQEMKNENKNIYQTSSKTLKHSC